MQFCEYHAGSDRYPTDQGNGSGWKRSRKTFFDDEPFAALAFKIMADPFVGKLAFFRVYSGTMNSGSYILNATKDKKERVGRILQMHANKRAGAGQGIFRRYRSSSWIQDHNYW